MAACACCSAAACCCCCCAAASRLACRFAAPPAIVPAAAPAAATARRARGARAVAGVSSILLRGLSGRRRRLDVHRVDVGLRLGPTEACPFVRRLLACALVLRRKDEDAEAG